MSKKQESIINGIDVNEYFINHYDNSGKLYAVEYKGNPLELQNAIKRLQEENKELRQIRKNSPDIQEPYIYLYRQIKKQCHKLEQENKKLTGVTNEAKIEYENLLINRNDFAERAEKLKQENEELKKQLEFSRTHKTVLDAERIKYKQALEKIRNIAEKLITELPEYHSCYYKDECSDNCTPKKQSKVEFCCYENVDKTLAIIDEVLNDRD